jgi:hypothetical protein
MKARAKADPYGMTTKKRQHKDKGNGNSRFLHCTPHDEAVRRFGRNDGFGVRREGDGEASGVICRCMGFSGSGGLRRLEIGRRLRLRPVDIA